MIGSRFGRARRPPLDQCVLPDTSTRTICWPSITASTGKWRRTNGDSVFWAGAFILGATDTPAECIARRAGLAHVTDVYMDVATIVELDAVVICGTSMPLATTSPGVHAALHSPTQHILLCLQTCRVRMPVHDSCSGWKHAVGLPT